MRSALIARCAFVFYCVASQGFWPAHADPPAPVPQPVLQPLAPGQVLRMGPAAGTGTATADYGIGATDLCEFVEFPSQLLQVCGDSFAGQGVGYGGWYAPVALRVDTDSVDDPDGVRYTGVTGISRPLLAEPTPPGASQLPAGVVQINRRNYLMVATTKNLEPQSSRLVRVDPARGGWETVAGSVRTASFQGGRQTQISGYYDPIPRPDSPTGWVYIVANSFTRRQPVVLYRATPEAFTDRSRWQGWSAGAGWNTGNKAPTPLWPDLVGEMSIKQIDGMTVLSYFNATTGDMEVRVAADPTALGSAPVTTVVQHDDDWPDPPESLPPPYDNRLSQPYGGYISPGSTIDELRIFVSQWDTRARQDAPYRVIQYAVNPFKP
ncbi:DUF4185 domain-containing protein [Mycobacterium paragordonae]|uniref:DUF4185 domain-containing protein n=1 Tax=Mycobacterium paragordonae TaxID=1389713 RepID=A0AAJ1W3E5_9MYCO|nr:DUF4185 domain-containing protein [Mycobacterium paragordonae]MDP7738230.1 DUF4185 domain-containing protein [Mycobacterium paragordonae]